VSVSVRRGQCTGHRSQRTSHRVSSTDYRKEMRDERVKALRLFRKARPRSKLLCINISIKGSRLAFGSRHRQSQNKTTIHCFRIGYFTFETKDEMLSQFKILSSTQTTYIMKIFSISTMTLVPFIFSVAEAEDLFTDVSDDFRSRWCVV
jgi:hypothetical protein